MGCLESQVVFPALIGKKTKGKKGVIKYKLFGTSSMKQNMSKLNIMSFYLQTFQNLLMLMMAFKKVVRKEIISNNQPRNVQK